jgi:dTDP-3-amino-3,4,6-trideoxy-alpha-D-glucose transaminase
MILTDDFTLYHRITELKDNGKTDGHLGAGTNSKMSEADCAQMLVKLKYFDKWQQRRTAIADYYTERLGGYFRVTEVAPDVVHAWHKYPIWMCDSQTVPMGTFARNTISHRLRNAGIDTKIHYSTPLNDLGCNPHSSFLNAQGDYPVGETHAKSELSLPIYPELTDLEVEYVVETITKSI